jgi:4-amino-4-deoxy-L-arabinose transferase-like glycosyltransferase
MAIAIPYFIHLGSSALWDSNEAFYAETPREMMESGNYLAPTFNYELRAQKPPLTYWWVLLGYAGVGVSELGVRLPSALAVLATLAFTYAAARMLFSPNAGLLAAAILATTLRLFVLARKLPIDVLLILWLTATACFFIRAVIARSRCAWLLAYASAALGFMTKGPIAWAVPGLACGIWLLWSRRLHLRDLHWLGGGSILIAVCAPWYLWTYAHYGWTYIADFFMSDNLGRFATEIKGPARGPLYYCAVYAADFFPWSIFSIPAGAFLWRSRRHWKPGSDLAYGFPLLWCAIVFLLFSCSKNKQEYYIAPLYPLAAVLLAGILDQTVLGADRRIRDLGWLWRVAAWTVAILLLVVAVLSPRIARIYIPDASGMLHYAPAVIFIGAIGIAIGYLIRDRFGRSILASMACLWLGFMIAATAYLPALEAMRPVKKICGVLARYAHSEDEIGYFRAAVPSMIFYLRRPIFTFSNPPAMAGKLAGSATVFCVLEDSDYRYFKEQFGLDLYVLNRYRQLPTRLGLMLRNQSSTGAGNDLLLISNRPIPAALSRDLR